MTLNALLLVLTALLAQEGPALLPQAPADWRGEKIELPPPFAPDLGYEGALELAFAPGMFERDSDSHFSYAMGLRLEGAVQVDAETLARFLERYYRGLCGSVAESRGLAIDTELITANVQPAGDDFHATVEMFDVFNAAEPLALRIEWSRHLGATGTDLLGLASALPEKEPIWQTLDALRDAWWAERYPPLFLNHVFIVLDAESYQAALESEFLRESFAVSETRRTVRADTSYEGLYCYGKHTYFEFLPAEANEELVPGSTGVAFGIERPGGTALVSNVLERAGITTFSGARSREHAGAQLPWFRIMGIERPNRTSLLSLFTMEYEPSFLEGWHGELAPSEGGIQRAKVLERYAAQLELVPEQKLFIDVVEVELELDETERERLLAVTETLGYAREKSPEDSEAIVLRGPDVRLRLLPSSTPGGVRALRMSLRREVEMDPVRLGKVTLTLEGKTALIRWDP